jgi:mRNA-degrading endonuclease RelE of RelBE toxin-antitoxin system
MPYRIEIQDRAIKSIKKISEPQKSLIKKKIELLKNFTKNMHNITKKLHDKMKSNLNFFNE